MFCNFMYVWLGKGVAVSNDNWDNCMYVEGLAYMYTTMSLKTLKCPWNAECNDLHVHC